MHHTEDTLLHFSCILCAENHDLVRLEVHLDSGLACHVLNWNGCLQFTCVEDMEVDLSVVREIARELFFSRANQHVLHEQCVV